jgi:hypothetical protein
VIASYDRQVEHLRVYDDTMIVAGSETVVWGGRMPGHYSFRSATTGSTRMARSAGR